MILQTTLPAYPLHARGLKPHRHVNANDQVPRASGPCIRRLAWPLGHSNEERNLRCGNHPDWKVHLH